MIEERKDQKKIKESDRIAWDVVFLMGLCFASFLSPQIIIWGRGMRLTALLLPYLVLIILITRRSDVFGALQGNIRYILFAGFFLWAGTIRYFIHSDGNILQNFVISPFVCLLFFGLMNLLKVQSKKTIETVRWFTLIILSVSLGLGIPVLIKQPGIARMTMGNPETARLYSFEYFPKGVSNYILYTAVAICWASMANWLIKNDTKYLKYVGWTLLAALAVAVAVSTFTMALLLLISGFLILMSIIFLKGRKTAKITTGAIIILLLYYYPIIYNSALSIHPTQFSANKATRLIVGAYNVGLVDADETGRVRRLLLTLKTIKQRPILGSWGIKKGFYFGGHSSWADFSAIFGIPGLVIWLVFLTPGWKRTKDAFNIDKVYAGGTITWILIFVGGILNPTFNIPPIFLLAWLYDNKIMNIDEI